MWQHQVYGLLEVRPEPGNIVLKEKNFIAWAQKKEIGQLNCFEQENSMLTKLL